MHSLPENNDTPTLAEVSHKLNQVLELLRGREIDKNDHGMIGDLRSALSRIGLIERWKDKTIAWAVGVSFGGGALVTLVIGLLVTRIKTPH